MTWSLEQAYDVYPQIEEEFSAALDESLHPRGPGQLLDLVAGMGLPPGAVALDVGCGEGSHALALHQRFGVRVTGIDPVHRYPEAARAAARQDGPAFTPGTAEDIPVGPGTADLVWCRDVLVHSPNGPRNTTATAAGNSCTPPGCSGTRPGTPTASAAPPTT